MQGKLKSGKWQEIDFLKLYLQKKMQNFQRRNNFLNFFSKNANFAIFKEKNSKIKN